jgi:hypothetical protein
VTDEALELVDLADERPWLLVVAYGDATEPYLPLEDFRRRIDVPLAARLLSTGELRAAAGDLPEGVERSEGFGDLVARYDAEVTYVDACVGRLADGLAQRGLLADALLVVASTHGQEFLEHGYVGSGWTLYEEAVRVPLVVRAPTLLAPARQSAPVSLADLQPTLAAVLGVSPGDAPRDGRALLAPSGGGLVPARIGGEVLCELVVPELAILRAAIGADAKRIDLLRPVPPGDRAALAARYDTLVTAMLEDPSSRPDPLAAPARFELYDLAGDPGETNDLWGAQERRFDDLRRALELYVESCRRHGLEGRGARAPQAAADEAELAELQQLGYL